MMNRLPLRFWLETVLSVLSTIMLALTLAMPDWIERIFGFEPDGGDGSTEWGWAISLAITAVALLVDARRLRLRATQASASTK